MMFVAWALLQVQAPVQTPPQLPPLHGGPAAMTCPVGGESFSAWQANMFSTYGSRPDGRPYSYLPFPLPVPECPSNHLVVFDTFSDAEVAALAKLIVTPAYAKLVANDDSAYYRAFWLATQLGRPDPDALSWLEAALWAVTPGFDEGPASKDGLARQRQYAFEFVDRVRHLAPATGAQNRVWLTARAANQLRQLGDFSGAKAMLRNARSVADQPGVDEGWRVHLDKLATVIGRRDASVEPLDMIPATEAARRCTRSGRHPLKRMEKRLCAAPEIVAADQF